MTHQDAWHSQDDFWELFGPILFSPERLARAPAEVEKIRKLLAIDAGVRILDLCCGTGRHALELARLGYDVVGVDRTRAYVEAARAEAARRNLAASFELGDMQTYRADDSFDVVLNLFGSFGYFDEDADDRRVVENVYASLRPGGQLMIETMGKEIMARDFEAAGWSEEGGQLLLWQRAVTRNWSRIETRWIAITDTERIEHRVSIRSYSAVELSSLLTQCGFGDVKFFGSLDGTAYDHAAQRLIVVATK